MQNKMQHGKFVPVLAGAAVLTALFVLVSPRAKAQSRPGAPPAEAAAPQSFEVASIKPSAEDDRKATVGIAPGGRYTASGITIKFLIQQAYDVKDFQVTAGPGWLNSERYDIVAKAETPEINRERIRALLQSLLAERFNFKFHRETKELPVYALVVGKGEPKLHKSETQTDLTESGGEPKVPSATAGAPAHGGLVRGRMLGVQEGALIRMRRGMVVAQMAGISDLVSILAQQLGRPVVDKTGLTGRYDFKLEWTPDEAMRGLTPFGEGSNQDVAPVTDAGSSIFTAVQEQLGLKLESQKGSAEFIVIDQIARPSPD